MNFYVNRIIFFILLSTTLFEHNERYDWIHEVVFVFVFVGSSTCDFSKDASLKGYVHEMSYLLESKSPNFRTIGISYGVDLEKELKYLNGVSSFDEIIIGDSRNSGMNMIFNDLQGLSIVPQIVILNRRYYDGLRYQYGYYHSQDIIYRIIGLDEIEKYTRLFENSSDFYIVLD